MPNVSKSSGVTNSSAPKPAPAPKPVSNKGSSAEGSKNVTPPDGGGKSTVDGTGPAPPSKDLGKTTDGLSGGNSSNFSDSFSLSKEGGHGGGSLSTDGTTSLVDHLVDAYTGEQSGIDKEFGSSNRCGSRSESCGTSLYGKGSDCGFSPWATREKMKRLDEAGEQVAEAQERVEKILDKAVDAKVYNKREVPEKDVRRAEKEQENLTKAEGRLHRTRLALSQKTESGRQKRFESGMEKQNAEQALLKKFENATPALRDHIMQTFKPRIARNPDSRKDLGKLEAEVDWHIKSDTEAQRLFQESEALHGKSKKGGRGTNAHTEKLRRDLENNHFRDRISNAAPEERGTLVRRELDKLGDASTQVKQEFEDKLNTQLSETQVRAANTSAVAGQGKDEDKRKRAVDTLLKTRETRSGKSGQEVDSLTEAVNNIDAESVRQTSTTLESLDENSIETVLDLNRALGRDASEVRSDLEQQIARGGKSVTRARKTVSTLDGLVRRTRLLSEADGWTALRQSAGGQGPNLNGFLGLPGGYYNGDPTLRRASGLFDCSGSQADPTVVRTLMRRMERTGARVESGEQEDVLSRLARFGTYG